MADVRDFLMPDLGEGLTEGEILQWLVAEGDSVSVDQPVAEVSTEKAVVEVPTPFGGRVVTLHGVPGDMIKVGTPLISVDVDAEAGAAGTTANPGGSGNVLVGYGTSDEPAVRPPRTETAAHAEPGPRAATPPASPLVRRLAAERGIDLTAIKGTGPGGVITRADIERAAPQGPPVAADGSAQQRTSGPTRLTGADRVAAERLTRSHQEIPTATATITADATALLAAREEIQAGAGNVHVTPFALLLRLCVVALRRFPRLNGHFDSAHNAMAESEAVHLGVAVQTERGLLVPVIRDAHSLGALRLAAELERVATAARAGQLSAAELKGSTFTVSNFGAFGVDGGTALINPPEVAILGVGRFVQRPWIVEGHIEPRTVVQLSLVFDHRVADGAVAGGFIKHLADLIEQPGALDDD